MNWSEALLLGTCALSLYGVGQVWLVQLSSYRLWTYVGPREFRAYHAAWWRGIWGVVLAPAALVTIGAMLVGLTISTLAAPPARRRRTLAVLP